MRFAPRKRRQAPNVIIISLIDILIVLLIFLMVTTTFKQQPSLRLALPESRQAQKGASEGNLIVTISKEEPHYYLGQRPVTLDKLTEELISKATQNPAIGLSVRPDKGATVENLMKVIDAAKAAKIKDFHINAVKPGQ